MSLERPNDLELKVYTGRDGVKLRVPIIAHLKRRGGRNRVANRGLVTDVEVKVLGFNAPVLGDGILKPGAGCPAGLGAAMRGRITGRPSKRS